MCLFPLRSALLILSMAIATFSFAQETNTKPTDSLETESVTVIKTFNPTINDAFKIETEISDNPFSNTSVKDTVYNIVSVPVASTFEPNKGKSVAVKKIKNILPYPNYALLSGGNFVNINAEAFVKYELQRDTYFSALLEHQSSQGGIDGVRTDDFFYDTNLRLGYQKADRDTPWEVYFGAAYKLYNWYGLPEELILTESQLNALDPSHNFINLELGGNVNFDNEYIKEANSQIRYFFDDQDRGEFNFKATSNFNLEVLDTALQVPVVLDFLTGNYSATDFSLATEYQLINFGISPTVNFNYNNWDFKVGLSTFLSADTENSETDFFVYPEVLINYPLPAYQSSVFAGVTGALQQNTYYQAVSENPFVAPFTAITPTSQTYNAFLGATGNITSQWGYQVKFSYKSEQNKALFQNTPAISSSQGQANFGFHNAFQYVYDDVKTGTISGKITYEKADNYKIGLEANAFIYDVSQTQEAWNLPAWNTTISADYFLNKKWHFEMDTFYVGARKDFDTFNNEITTLDGYLDINLGANYSINKHWNAFVKGKNLTSQNYERWLNVPVQSAQGLVGVRYNFE